MKKIYFNQLEELMGGRLAEGGHGQLYAICLTVQATPAFDSPGLADLMAICAVV